MKKILVIDDDDLVRELYRTLLKKLDYEILVAEGGREGIELFDESIDLVVTDIVMDDMDGLEVIEELRRLSPDVKVIAISGNIQIGNIDTLELARSYGAQAALGKPIDWKHMVHTIKTLLQTEPAEMASEK